MSTNSCVHVHTAEDCFAARADFTDHLHYADNVALSVVLPGVGDSDHLHYAERGFSIKKDYFDKIYHFADTAILDVHLLVNDARHHHDAVPPWGDPDEGLRFTLEPYGSFHTNSPDAIILVQHYSLEPDNTYHATDIESGAVAINYDVEVTYSSHRHYSDQPPVRETLGVDSGDHTHAAESPTPNTFYTLDAQECVHLNVPDVVPFLKTLAPDEAYHAHAAAALEVVPGLVGDAYHAHDGEGLTSLTEIDDPLTVADTWHSHTGEHIFGSMTDILLVDDPYHLHTITTLLSDESRVSGVVLDYIEVNPTLAPYDSVHRHDTPTLVLDMVVVPDLVGEVVLPALYFSGRIDDIYANPILPALDVEATVRLSISVSGSAELPAMGLLASVRVDRSLEANALLPPLSVEATMSRGLAVSGALDLAALSVEATIDEALTAEADAELPAIDWGGTIMVTADDEIKLVHQQEGENWDVFA